MADFKTALHALSRGDLPFDKVTQTIDKLLTKQPQMAMDIMEQLREAYSEDLIDAQLYARLKKTIAEHTGNPATAGGDERTVFDDGRDSDGVEKTVFEDSGNFTFDTPGADGSISVTDTSTVDFDLTGESGPSTDSSWPSAPTSGSQTGAAETGWGAPGEPRAEMKIEPGAVLKERFKLDAVLGVGGMGTVYKGRDLIKVEARDRNPYMALKVLNEDFKQHPDSFIALQREASRQQKLAHPNIATVYDFDRTSGGTVFLTMELLEGEALNDFIKKTARPRGGLPFEEAYPMVEGLGNALVYAHERKIVHSDFKPGNCFINKDGTMKVLDFGIARAVKNPGQGEGEKTLFDPGKLGALTPAYASLEMLEGEEPDPRDDIYALACVAYELLVGKHPFNKLPANTARDNKLVPAPVKNLTRRQHKGLMRGLAFAREDRSQSVEQFLEEFEGKTSPFKNPFIMVPAAVVVIALVGAVPTLNYLEDRDIDNRIALLQTSWESGDVETVSAVLAGLKEDEIDPEDRDRVLLTARDEILDFYEQQVGDHVDVEQGTYDFAGAQAIIDEVSDYDAYKDSQQVVELQEELDQQKKVLLSVQTDTFNSALENGELLRTDEREDVFDAIDVVSQFAPDAVIGLKRRLPGAYSAAIDRALVNEEYELADSLATAGRGILPDNKGLQNLVDKVVGARERAELTSAILKYTQSIQNAVAGSDRLSAILPVQEEFKKLQGIDPGNALLTELASRFGPLVKKEIDALNRAKNWGASDLMAGDYGPSLIAMGLRDLNFRTLKLRDQFAGEIGKVVAAITAAVASQQLTAPAKPNAAGLLSDLVTMAPSHERTSEARDLVSRAHLREARVARAGGEFDAARKHISAARTLEPTAPLAALVGSEFETIDNDAALDTAAREQVTGGRQADFDQRIGGLEQKTTTLPADIEAINKALTELDQLESLSPADPRLGDLRTQIGARLAGVTDQIGETAGWEAAVAVTRDAIAYAPGSADLASTLNSLEAKQREASVAAQRKYVADRKQEVETLLAAATADRPWNNQIQQKMADIGALAESDDAWIGETSTKIAEVYVQAATTMRETERFAEGANMLARAERYAPAFPALTSEREALTAATEAFEQEQREQERLARVDGLKQTFETQVNANDVANGAKTLERLRRELPEDDVFIAKQAPKMLGNAYYRLATRKATDEDFASALKFAKAGLKLDRSQKLRLAVNQYTVDGNKQELAKIFSRSEAYDLTEVLQKIAEVQTLDPQAYGEAENEWARSVVSRIETLQESDGLASNPLLSHAQEVFAGNQLVAALEPAGAAAAAPSKYSADIRAAMDAAMLTKARELIKTATAKEGQHPDIIQLKGAYNTEINKAKALYEDYKTAFSAKQYDKAQTVIDQALGTWSDSNTFKREKARVLAALSPDGTVSAGVELLPPPPSASPCKDSLAGHGKRKKGTCYDWVAQKARGPLMVVVPSGGDFGKSFAIGKYEVTVTDFNNYCKLSGACQPLSGREGSMPAAGVTLDQAKAYAQWLSERTGNVYRLPTAEEWTYAAEAGGKQPQKDYNCRVEQGGQILKGQSAMGVNTGKANGWGLYNYVGNVQEWVISGGGVVARGGAFEDTFSKCSITLEKSHDGNADDSTGFRLLQELG